MIWNDYCKKNRIGSLFHEASFEDCILDGNLIQMGRDLIRNAQSLIIHGKAGRGKTYYSLCLLRYIVELKADVRWLKSKGFEDKLVEEIRGYGNAKGTIEMFADYDFLFIDDFGTETTNDDVVREWYHLIDDRWSNAKQTVFTTNLNQDEILKKYGERIFSRFKDFEWIEFEGEDLRGKK